LSDVETDPQLYPEMPRCGGLALKNLALDFDRTTKSVY